MSRAGIGCVHDAQDPCWPKEGWCNHCTKKSVNPRGLPACHLWENCIHNKNATVTFQTDRFSCRKWTKKEEEKCYGCEADDHFVHNCPLNTVEVEEEKWRATFPAGERVAVAWRVTKKDAKGKMLHTRVTSDRRVAQTGGVAEGGAAQATAGPAQQEA
jgi:hypothetical protein